MKFSQRQIILLIICILNIAFFALTLSKSIIKGRVNTFFLYFTIENFIWCTVYLCFVTTCEILELFDWNAYLFTIRRIGKYLFSTAWTVVSTFWIFTLMGNDIINWKGDLSSILMTSYVHLLIGLFMIYELVSNKERHYVKGVFYKDLIVLLMIFVIYSSLLIIIAKVSHVYVYDFLKKDIVSCIGYTLSTLTNFICSYLLYYFFIRRFNKGVVHHNEIETIEIPDNEVELVREELV